MRRRATPTVGAVDAFEGAVVALCREMGYHRRYRPTEIDHIVRGVTTEDLASTLEELAGYVEREDWVELEAMAARERTRRDLAAMRGRAW